MKLYSLDVAAPEDVAKVLASVADHYRESSADLAGAWQDASAGKLWADFAQILDRAAVACRKAVKNRLG
jgi:hypothetical protein